MEERLKQLHIKAGGIAGREKTCGNKERHHGEYEAVIAADRLNKSGKARHEVEPYPCAFCNVWHIGGIMTVEVMEKILEEHAKKFLSHPSEIKWREDELPDVQEVAYDCVLLAWFVSDDEWESFRGIKMVLPYENDLNPLRWCDNSCSPIGYEEKVKYWAWITQ